ncbi:transposase [Anaeromyxobacter paludicola]|uniref:Uncharacterized protein n=1 Tax=Anaeromyxobacter paludicola TaxID=2918171 RepID=A0ABM7X7R8_9BACT|nr:transposase [Anaeromyxobacter paludicola]BDG07879.1 hypothetical protein AMPC_09920 [Anaeromyxobacter paludicola]
MKCLDDGFVAATQFYAFPQEHWHRIRSTNGSSGSTARSGAGRGRWGPSPDWASALRLVTAVALQVTAIWTDRRYLDMDLLTSHHSGDAMAA